MAKKLADIWGTEEDKVFCPFYAKIGACRHGDKCTRIHNKPSVSPTLLVAHMYDNPPAAIAMAGGARLPEENVKELQRHFEDFYEEIFLEFSKYGEIQDLFVCDNVGDHLLGNVYVEFTSDDASEGCMKGLAGRYYAGKIIMPEYSPVTNFRDARCRQYDKGECDRGGYCNFMHLKHVSRSFKSSLFREMYKEHPDYKRGKKKDDKGRRSKSRSRSREKKPARRSKSRSNSKGRGGKHKRDRKKSRSVEKPRIRSRSKSRDKRKSRSKSKSHESPEPVRQTSEERRAMIAGWNQEEEAKTKNNGSH